jgi:type I restriction enzyme, S subunit
MRVDQPGEPQDLRQTSLPTTWAQAPFGALFEAISTDGKKIPQKQYKTQGRIPVIDQGSKLIGGFTDNKSCQISSDKPLLVFGDHTRIFKYVDFTFAPGADGIKVLRPVLIDSRYAFYISHALPLRNKGYARHYQDLCKCIFPIAPSGEQLQIVDKLDELFSELDAGVASLKRAKVLLKNYRQAVLKAAVTGELTRDWRRRHSGEVRESGAELLQRILKARRQACEAAELKKLRAKGKPPKDDRWEQKYKEPQPPNATGLPLLPEGWVWATVDQLSVRVANGLSKKPRVGPPGAPILRISAVRAMSVDLHDIRYYPAETGEDLVDYVVNRGDLLFTRYNGSFELVGVCGAVAVEKAILHPDKLIRAKLASQEMTDAELLAAFLSAGVSRAFIERHIKTTAGQHGIAGSDIKRVPIPLAPVAEQQAIISLIGEAWSSSDQIEQFIETELLRADRTRQAILKAAFSGKLLPQDPNDEPASVLLERIRAERAAKPRPARGRRTRGVTNRQLELLS